MGITTIYINTLSNTPQSYTDEFILATGISDATIISALTQLEADLTTAGLIDYNNPSINKFIALYPIVGGTANTHKYNFLNAQDTDAAFRLVFSAGVTHNANGMTGNGTTGLANTNWIPSTLVSINDIHVSFYSRTNNSQVAYDMYCDNLIVEVAIGARHTVGKWFVGANDTEAFITYVGDSRGLIMYTRINNTTCVIYQNGLILNSPVINSISAPTVALYLMAANLNGVGGLFSIRNYAMFTIGLTLDSVQALDMYNAVQTFQTTLGRQV